MPEQSTAGASAQAIVESATFQSLGLGGLSFPQKVALLARLSAELEADATAGSMLTETQREELKRRVEYADARPDEWVSWEDAKAATIRRLSQ